MRPITLNPLSLPAPSPTRGQVAIRAREFASTALGAAASAARHVLYLPQVLVAIPVYVALRCTRPNR